jgi:glycerol-3-phosphate acyltransferase PlsY
VTGRQAAVLLASYVVGGIPFSYLIGRASLGVDLRTVGTGTATPTNLRRVGSVRLAVVAGAVEMAKGAIGPAVVGSDHPVLAAMAGALAIAGHNWSPFLRGGGGRGISPATGALWVVAWPGAVYLGAWLLAGVFAARLAPPTSGRAEPTAIPQPSPSGPLQQAPGMREHRAAGSWRPKPDRVLAAMRLGLFTLLPFLALVRGVEGLLIGLILLAPIGFKTMHEISRRRLLPGLRRRT